MRLTSVGKLHFQTETDALPIRRRFRSEARIFEPEATFQRIFLIHEIAVIRAYLPRRDIESRYRVSNSALYFAVRRDIVGEGSHLNTITNKSEEESERRGPFTAANYRGSAKGGFSGGGTFSSTDARCLRLRSGLS